MGNRAKGKKGMHPSAEKPISLKPLEFDEAVADILKVKPKATKGVIDMPKNKESPIGAGKQEKKLNKAEKRLLRQQTRDSAIAKKSRGKK